MKLNDFTLLKDICEFIIDCEHKTAPTQEEGFASVRTPNIGRGRLLLGNANRVSEETYSNWTKRATPQAGDLILAREAPVGNVAIVLLGMQVCLGQRVVLIRPNVDKVDPNYLLYLLLGDEIQNKFYALTAGVTVPHLNMSEIRNLKLPEMPSRGVQNAIGLILSAYDDLIENNLRRIKILEEMAQNTFTEWFVKFHFPGYENVQMADSPLGRIPKGWKITNLADMVDFIRGSEPGSRNYLDYPEAGTVPFLRVGDFGDRASKIFVKEELVSNKILTKEDIALTLDGTVGIVRIGLQGAYSTGIRKTKIRDIKTLPWSYLYFLLLSKHIQQIIKSNAQGTTILHAGSAIEHMVFPLPSIGIMRLFDNFASLALTSIIILHDKVNTLRRTRDLLLPKLISGEFDVSDLDIKTGDDE